MNPAPARRLAVLVAGLCLTLLSACGIPRSGRADPIKPAFAAVPLLTWVGEFTRPSGAAYPLITDRARFGSLSGLVQDASGQWLSVIDDREGTRVAWLAITVAGGRLEVSPTRMQPLRAGPGVPPRAVTQADLEAITALPDGTFLVSEEGHKTRDGGLWQPLMLQVDRDGLVSRVIEFPKEFHITADGKTGLRDNQGFESLTITPRGRVIAGLEQPLLNEPLTTFARGGESRLIEFERRGAGWRPGRQWRYTLSPTPVVEGFPAVCDGGENGLVELLAIDETRLLALERACLQSADGTRVTNPVQLFAVTLEHGTAEKTLVLDLSSLVPRLSPELARLENFEALAFGPSLDGQRTLLIVSDDNFRASQKTAFLLFGIR